MISPLSSHSISQYLSNPINLFQVIIELSVINKYLINEHTLQVPTTEQIILITNQSN